MMPTKPRSTVDEEEYRSKKAKLESLISEAEESEDSESEFSSLLESEYLSRCIEIGAFDLIDQLISASDEYEFEEANVSNGRSATGRAVAYTTLLWSDLPNAVDVAESFLPSSPSDFSDTLSVTEILETVASSGTSAQHLSDVFELCTQEYADLESAVDMFQSVVIKVVTQTIRKCLLTGIN